MSILYRGKTLIVLSFLCASIIFLFSGLLVEKDGKKNKADIQNSHGAQKIEFNEDNKLTETQKALTAFSDPKPKVILLGNDLEGKEDWGLAMNTKELFEKLKCEVTNCIFTMNSKDIKIANAIFFHQIPNKFPSYRRADQRWIFVNHEPPNSGYTKEYADVFNWTITYRYDADMYMPYEYVCKRDTPIKIDFKNEIKEKTKKVAWFVSNCNAMSKRSEYVRELMKYIDVDVYGKCSELFGQNNQCSRKLKMNECYKMIEKKYKFYLSFESCFDVGYITEKYYNILKYNIIPIVRGEGDYTRSGVPNSYIHTKDFKSPKHLAQYLHRLDKNDTEYISYLKHRETHGALSDGIKCTPLERDNEWCRVCQKLNNPKEPVKSYSSLKDWWGTCHQPPDLNQITNNNIWFYVKKLGIL